MSKDKTLQFLTYVVKNYPNVSITGLMKLSYIIDLVAIKKGKDKVINAQDKSRSGTEDLKHNCFRSM